MGPPKSRSMRRLAKRKNWASGPPLCAFFLRGKCKYDTGCKFSHDVDSGDQSKIPTCKFWLEGNCKYGDYCMFSHMSDGNLDELTIQNAQILTQANAAQQLGYQWMYNPETGSAQVVCPEVYSQQAVMYADPSQAAAAYGYPAAGFVGGMQLPGQAVGYPPPQQQVAYAAVPQPGLQAQYPPPGHGGQPGLPPPGGQPFQSGEGGAPVLAQGGAHILGSPPQGSPQHFGGGQQQLPFQGGGGPQQQHPPFPNASPPHSYSNGQHPQQHYNDPGPRQLQHSDARQGQPVTIGQYAGDRPSPQNKQSGIHRTGPFPGAGVSRAPPGGTKRPLDATGHSGPRSKKPRSAPVKEA